VVFVRDQHVAEHQLRALARQFGPLSMHPVARLTGAHRDVNVIEDSAERPPAGFDWHTDLSWTAEPPHFGFLSAVDVPPIGGDTLWASGRAIYDRLDPARQRQLGALRIVHAPDDALLDTVRRHHGAALAAQLIAGHPPIQHPLVRRDPHTASPALWLSPLYARSVAGLSEGASSRLLRSLHRELDNPEVQVRWRWSVGDIAIWDESTTCHRALTDHAPQRRVMRRCTTAGERPAPAPTHGS
jgi:taurine dioxygenase